ncbi:hypothetical protein [Planobispora takensis]|uniref:Uncharacterized protein n=1 Tax=Planobispora takensis TaxID=1367882 RepID=A0A8J3WTY9_9ACTN|nr:hypothetical protein [Planobispora takensis]GIH99376.1 hypothetical protein Pta02_13850 [Planobispora takensis]
MGGIIYGTFLMALFVILVVTIVGVVSTEVRTAFGHEGTPGVATVLSCEPHTVGSGRSRRTNYDCEARFVFDDPSRPPIVIDTVPEAEVGQVFPGVLTAEGDRVLPTGEFGRWRAVLVPAGLGLGLAATVFFGAIMTGSRKAIIVTGVLMLPFLAVVIIAGIAVA